MRRMVLVVVLACGCGDFLGFGSDDDDAPAPPPAPPPAEAGSDGDAATADGGADPVEAGTWRCFSAVDAGGPAFDDEIACTTAMLGECSGLPEPTGECDRQTDEQQTSCTTCQKNGQGSYTYSKSICVCR